MKFDSLNLLILLFKLLVLFEEELVASGEFEGFFVHFLLHRVGGTRSSLVEEGRFLEMFSRD